MSSPHAPSPSPPADPPFDPLPILTYLSLPPTYSPSPSTHPLPFLRQHLSSLPPSHAAPFSLLLTPAERAHLPLIRNRRLAYSLQQPPPAQLTWTHAAPREPALWTSLGASRLGIALPRPGEQEEQEEREWAKREFVGRRGPEGAGMVGDLGKLLGGYEMERVGERERDARRARALLASQHQGAEEQGKEEQGEEEQGEDEEMDSLSSHETSSSDDSGAGAEGIKAAFERAVRERFVAGLLEWADYACDWEDGWDGEWEREGEEAWFDADEDDMQEEEGEGGTGVLDY
ncbi:hypothetical protein CALVIDRAFT_560851 [Calocera viscosa TUFC12733]|uniref:CCD97-like C-terminal domain-containing protein n=1 Tax=Calocera viscosa (strain TUFC12733) TaxID=1330018 RepID=A0A167QUV3_CALVF|nr:hypothetical protein CALVIDRAFT_560851 [Calocera viscosa TUFC12733]